MPCPPSSTPLPPPRARAGWQGRRCQGCSAAGRAEQGDKPKGPTRDGAGAMLGGGWWWLALCIEASEGKGEPETASRSGTITEGELDGMPWMPALPCPALSGVCVQCVRACV